MGPALFYYDRILIFTTRRYASTVYAVVVCLCVLSLADIVSKWLNLGAHK